MTITELAVKRPTLVIVFFTILVFWGWQSYTKLPYELLPNLGTPVFTVLTPYPGGAPEAVENDVTRPVENIVSSLEGVQSIKAISMENASVVTVDFESGTDIDRAVQDAQRALSANRAAFPAGIEAPGVKKFSYNDLPVMRLGLTASIDNLEFTRLVEEEIQPQFARLKGVGQVTVDGGETREIQINVDGKKLLYYNLSILQISQAISTSDLELPSGNIRDQDREMLIRLSGRIRSLDQLRSIVIATLPDGSSINLEDVAEIYDTRKEQQIITRINGNPSLGIAISKQSGGNSVEISRLVRAKIEELEQQYSAQHLRFAIADDESIVTLRATEGVLDDLVLAIVLVAVIMLLFLHSIRNALIVMVAIPVSIVVTFGFMSLAGFSLNLMTLLGLSLVIGVLVDDSIVVLEFVHQQMEQGMSAWDAAMNKWDQIGLSVSAISLVIVVVFLPLSFVTGSAGDLLRPYAVVVVIATLVSLLVSFTLTTYLTSRFIRLARLNPKNPIHRILILFEQLLNSFKAFYRSILQVALRRKWLALASIFALIATSFALLSQGYIGSEFMASGDNGKFVLGMELDKETPLQKTNLVTEQIEALLLQHPEVRTVYTTVGKRSGSAGLAATPYASTINVELVPAEERDRSQKEIARALKTTLRETIPGVKFSALSVGLAGAAAAPVEIIVQGTDLKKMVEFGDALVKQVRAVAGTEEVRMTVEGGGPELDVEVDDQKLAALGLTLDQVGLTMQYALTGASGAEFLDDNQSYTIRVLLDAFDRKNKADLENLTFLNKRGELVKLGQFARIVETSGPSRLERRNKVNSLVVEAHTLQRGLESINRDIQSRIDAMQVPEGITVNASGKLKDQQEAFQSLGTALLTAILLAYLIMVALYNNYIYPLITLFSVPVSIIGALLALALAMENLSIFGMLGFIMLVGLVIKNAILIVDFANELKAEGMNSKEAVIESTMERFRPILMTTIAMVIAMVPVATATGAGAEWKNGLAWVLIGGLTSSMLLTLIIVPVAYNISDDITARARKVFGGKHQKGK